MTNSRQENWFNTAVGRAMNLDAVAGLQCVDVPNDYAEWLFGNWERTIGRGDARQKYAIAPAAYWEKIPYTAGATPQRGDVIVWPGSSIVPEGHTAVVTGAGGSTISVIEQSGGTNRAAYATTHGYRVNGVLPTGWLRPIQSRIIGGIDMDIKLAINGMNQAAYGKPMDPKVLEEKYQYIINGGNWKQLTSDIFQNSPWYRNLPRTIEEIYAAAGKVVDPKTKEVLGYDLGEGRLTLTALVRDVCQVAGTTPDPATLEKAKKYDELKAALDAVQRLSA